jgi:DNA-binding CsgD family transcriptional regulator
MGRHAIHNLEDKSVDIITYYILGHKSLREISRIYSVHPEMVKRLLKRHGCAIRHRTEAMKIWHEQKLGKKE